MKRVFVFCSKISKLSTRQLQCRYIMPSLSLDVCAEETCRPLFFNDVSRADQRWQLLWKHARERNNAQVFISWVLDVFKPKEMAFLHRRGMCTGDESWIVTSSRRQKRARVRLAIFFLAEQSKFCADRLAGKLVLMLF